MTEEQYHRELEIAERRFENRNDNLEESFCQGCFDCCFTTKRKCTRDEDDFNL